jgi:serine phosphatase RsbU (regulator of sigma subunit)
MDDIRKTQLHRDYGRELKDLYRFYLDEDRRAKLEGMSRIARAFSMLGWIMKSLLMKLSPPRRLLLLVALVLAVPGRTRFAISGFQEVTIDLRLWACLLLLIVLMLELKDKLLARDEIEIARQVQLALLPHEHPEVPGWSVWSFSRPANDVGGDLVDYIPLGGFRHGVLLGDVAGKGLGAALLSAKLQATLRALVPNAVSLDELGGQVNEIFYRAGLDNRFATLFYAELEHHSGELRYVNAGHNPAYLLRTAGIEELGASSRPVGMLESSTYEEGAVKMESGDMLVAYSDGLTEAEDSSGEPFGEQRVKELLPDLREMAPQAVGRRVLKTVDRFLGEARPTDDLSLVIVVKQ